MSSEMLPATPALSRLSDSSDSSGDGSPGHSSYAEQQFVQAECTSLHEGRQQISTILPVNIDTLFQTMYARSKFLDEFHASRKIYDIEHTDWRLDEETNKRRRTFKCKMPIKASIGPKFSCITEIQTLRECSVPGSLYSVDITSFNENVPYGDVFTIYVHHCLVRTVDDHTMFAVYLHVKFRKSVFSVIKSLIEKSTYSGVEDFHNDLALQLSRHFCTPLVRHKRHARNASRSSNALPELPGDRPSTPKSPTKSHKSRTAHAAESTTTDSASPKGAAAPRPQAHAKHTATGTATYSAKELFVQQPSTAAGLVAAQARSAASVLMLVMIAVSLLNVGLFIRLHMLHPSAAAAGGRQFGQPHDLLLMHNIRPQDVANLSSDQWLRMFYSYHVQHQSRVAEMRDLLVASIGTLREMEEKMLAVMGATTVESAAPLQPDAGGRDGRLKEERTTETLLTDDEVR